MLRRLLLQRRLFLRAPPPPGLLLRAFSSAGGPAGDAPPRAGIAALAHRVSRGVAIAANTLGPYTAMGLGSCVVVYGVSSLALHVSTSILSLTLTDALYGGFGAGFLSCAALALAAARAHRSVTLHPDAVFKVALARVAGDARVGAALGASVKAGPLQAYNSVPGHVSTQKLGWVDPRVQMLFNVVGEDTGREGMVRGLAERGHCVCVGGGGRGALGPRAAHIAAHLRTPTAPSPRARPRWKPSSTRAR